MARRSISYFAEERGRNKNPNFYINARDEDLRRNVKRIIRDIKNNNIEEQDLVYFQNDKIISACITESFTQWRTAETIKNALMYYNNTFLITNNVPYPNCNIWEERIYTSNEMGKYANKANLWNIAYKTFVDISRGADIRLALYNICKIDAKMFYDL